MSSYLQYHIGCSGWSYSAWQGPFYPLNLENSRWLSYYSQVFDFLEIDSSFYRIPNAFMVKNWVFEDLDGSQARVIFFGIVTARFLSRAREEKQDRLNLAIVGSKQSLCWFLVLELLTHLEKCLIYQK